MWVRSSDRAALKRRVFRDDYEYAPEFDRPAFNESRDPGPPTADVFEPKPAQPHPVSQAYTPEPLSTGLSVIGTVRTLVETDYRVTNVATERGLVHLTVAPISDPDRNRLREIYANAETYELVKLVAADKLFVSGPFKEVYDDEFTITMGFVQGVPVVTRVHGIAGFDEHGREYQDDGKVVDFTFTDIRFPASLPDGYFNPRQWGAHQNEYPQ